MDLSRDLGHTIPKRLINFNEVHTPNIKSPMQQSVEGDMFPGLNSTESYKLLLDQQIDDGRINPSPIRHPSLGRMQHTRNYPSSYAFQEAIQNSE